jgi:hypothetical protein
MCAPLFQHTFHYHTLFPLSSLFLLSCLMGVVSFLIIYIVQIFKHFVSLPYSIAIEFIVSLCFLNIYIVQICLRPSV